MAALPSVLPSEPALQDGLLFRRTHIILDADVASLANTTPQQIEAGHARVTNPAE